MGEGEPTQLRARLSLTGQIMLVGAVTLALILGWAWLNLNARTQLDELLAHQVQLESQEEKLNLLGKRLSEAQREAASLIISRSPDAFERFTQASETARAEAELLRQLIEAPELIAKLELLLDAQSKYRQAVAEINRVQRRLGLGFGESEGLSPKLAAQGRGIAERLRSAQLLELELELADIELAQRDFAASLDMRVLERSLERTEALRERLPEDVDPQTRAALADYREGLSALSNSTLELELAVNHARLEYELIGPELAAIDSSLDAAHADTNAAIEAQRDTDMLRSASLFSVAFITTVVFLLLQLRGAQVFARRVRALANVMEQVADGDISKLSEFEAPSPGARQEIRVLNREFGRMLAMLDELARATRAIAQGDLSVELSSPGELQDAFRAMIAELRNNVAQTREGAATIAAAAAEIGEAAAGQEQAATYQAEGIREVSVAMQRLAEAAGDISDAASEVLANADETRTRAEGLVSNFSELEQLLEQVTTLLQRIQDISDRSDLLALNGSLEATRAGEAGRGFALVAGEMRRLAERVKGTVGGIRAAVVNIDEATSRTAQATTEGSNLAKRTSAVAERIVELTEAQSAETEQVSAGVQDIALVLESSSAVSSETRFAASELEHRARALTQLVERFELEGASEAEDETPRGASE